MGLSTLGITFGYGTGASASAVTYAQLDRIGSVGEITADPEAIDVSTLEDYETKFVEGRTSVSDTVAVTVNWTDETEEEWETVLSTYKALGSDAKMYFEIIIPGMAKGCFFAAAPPSILPMPSLDQNGALVNTINLKLKEYVGWATKKAFS